MNLKDIDPRFVNEYKQLDGRHVSCGPCVDSTLRVNISTCPTNENGSPSPNCMQNANIECKYNINNISYNQNVTFPNFVNTQSINTFFCFEPITNQPTLQPTLQN